MKKKSAKRTKKKTASARPRFDRTIVIDGYNLILRTPAIRPDEKRDLRESREKLVNLLSWAVGSGEADIHIIFDGSDSVVSSMQPQRSGNVVTHFSTPPQSADDVIREMVEEYHDRGDTLTVVTSDVEVATHARACGATILLSDLFAASLFPDSVKEQIEGLKRQKKRGEEEGSEKPLGFSKKELEEWARLFSEQREEEEY